MSFVSSFLGHGVHSVVTDRDETAIFYVLPVLLMTSSFQIIQGIGPN